MKECLYCNKSLSIESFYSNQSICISCFSEKNKHYYNKNKIKKRDYYKQNASQYYLNNKEKKENYYQNNRSKIIKYNTENKKVRKSIDPSYKLIEGLRIRIYNQLKKSKTYKNNTTLKYLGCSLDKFKSYIEFQFKPEMGWDNWGEIWELDHIKPLSLFDFSIEENLYKALNYKNHQPLFKTTKIALDLGYNNEIGNRNKYNKVI